MEHDSQVNVEGSRYVPEAQPSAVALNFKGRSAYTPVHDAPATKQQSAQPTDRHEYVLRMNGEALGPRPLKIAPKLKLLPDVLADTVLSLRGALNSCIISTGGVTAFGEAAPPRDTLAAAKKQATPSAPTPQG